MTCNYEYEYTVDTTDPGDGDDNENGDSENSGGTDDSSTPGTRETETKTGTGSTTATCTVTVNPAPIKPTTLSATLSATLLTLVVNKGGSNSSTLKATAAYTPSNADPSLIQYKWTSSNVNVVQISGGAATGESSSATLTAAGEGEATVTCVVSADGLTSTTLTCRVVVNPPVNDLALSSNSGTLEVGKQVAVTALPSPASTNVTWKSSDDKVATVGSTDSNGHTAIIYGNRPGTAVISATAAIGEGNQASAEYNVTVSGLWIEEADRNITLQENGSHLLPNVQRYGAAANGTLVWQSSAPSVAKVSGTNIMGVGPGSATITGYVGAYEVSFNVSVSADSATTLEVGSIRADQTLSFNSLLSKIAAQAPGGLSHVTGLSVPTSQGTLYYRYTSSDEPNEGVAQNGSYYYQPGTGQKGLSEVTFVPNPTYGGGTVTISYTVVSKTNQNYSCRIMVEVQPNESTDMSMTTTTVSPAWFSADQFSTICRQETGNSLDYVIFSLPPASQGTLYFDYINADNYGGKVAAGTQYRLKDLDGIAFVPTAGFTGSCTIYYTARSVGTRGTSYSGRVIINVERETITSPDGPYDNVSRDGVYYNVPHGGSITLNDEDFNNYRSSILIQSSTLSRIQFDTLPYASQGTLYYNYRSASSTGTLVSAGTSYYYGTRSPRLDWVTFVPAEDFSGVVLIPFTGWDIDGHLFTGTLEINVRSGGGTGDILYTCIPGRTVNMTLKDFTDLCQDLTGRSLSYIMFQDLPDRTSEGSLYHNSTRIAATGTRYYNTSGTYRIRNLSFQASSSFSGEVNIPFIGYATNGDSFNGVMTIEALSYGDGGNLYYSATTKDPAVFSRDDFNEVSQLATRYNISSVKFEIPSTSQGDLYRSYRSLTSKGTRITSSSTSVTASSLNQVAFIPAAGYTGTVLINFTATASGDGGSFTGTVEIEVGRPAADVTASYATRVSPVNLRAEDLKKSNTTLSSVRFTAMPSSSEGYLYYRYTSPTQYDRQAGTTTSYNVSGSNLISDLVFVPRAGFSGTVTIPYVGTNSNKTTFEGEVVITVSPTRTSAHFNDMSGYSDQQRAAVDYLYESNITVGVGGGQYGPEQSITRGEFAVMVYKAFDIPISYTSPFYDVPGNAYYAEAVNSLYAQNIVSGIGNGAFAPGDYVTRQDAVCMVQRAMRSVGWSTSDTYSSILSGYSDGSRVSSYAQGPVSYAMVMGYLPIYGGQLQPLDNLTRVDMAQILHRVLTY